MDLSGNVEKRKQGIKKNQEAQNIRKVFSIMKIKKPTR
jgi:hypothetical protein